MSDPIIKSIVAIKVLAQQLEQVPLATSKKVYHNNKKRQAPSESRQKALAGPPSCSAGGKEVELTLNERYQGSISCHECGVRHLNEKVRADDSGRRFVTIPAHKIPVELHELRKRLEREAARSGG